MVDFTGTIVEQVEEDVLVQFVQFDVGQLVPDGRVGQVLFWHLRVKVLDSAREVGPGTAKSLVEIPSEPFSILFKIKQHKL